MNIKLIPCLYHRAPYLLVLQLDQCFNYLLLIVQFQCQKLQVHISTNKNSISQEI